MEQTEQQYVTIKEFATLANVTTQAVYKRLNQTDSSLNKFVKYNGKMKLISKDALELFADAPINQQGEGDGIDDARGGIRQGAVQIEKDRFHQKSTV